MKIEIEMGDDLTPETKVRLSIREWVAYSIALISIAINGLGFFGVIPNSAAQEVKEINCDTIVRCADDTFITKEKLQDSIRLFEKDIEYLKKSHQEQQKQTEKTQDTLEKMMDILLKINRNTPP